MKNLFSILLFAVLSPALNAAPLQGQRVTGPIVPSDSTDTYPTHYDTFGSGGYRSVVDELAKEAIPAGRRVAGMLVHVRSTGAIYLLGTNLTTWTATSIGTNDVSSQLLERVRKVSSRADLGSLAPLADGEVVLVSKFSTNSDWGSLRSFTYDEGSNLQTVAGCVEDYGSGQWIAPDCFGGGPVDVRWFGASDSPALSVTSHSQIQSAIDFVNTRTNSSGNRVGGTVKIPAGIYAISSTIILRPRVNLVGEHSHYSDQNYVTTTVTNTSYAAGGSVQIVPLGNSNVPVFTNDPTDPELYHRQSGEPQEDGSVADSKQYSILLKGITVYVASQTKYDCHILKLYNAWGVRVEDCYFWTRFGYAIWLKDCNAFKAINSRFIGGSFTEGSRGILMWGTGDSKIVDCELGGMVGPGVWITGSSAGKDTLIGNQIFNQQRHSQQISGYDTSNDTLTLSANHWLETGMLAEWTKEGGATPSTNLNQWQPYWVIKVSTNSLKLATTESNALAGVAIDLTGSIAGTNYIWSGPGASLYGSWAAENMVVTGNRFEQNQETGIYLSDAPGWEITGNMTYYNQYDNVGGVKDSISVPNIYLRGNNVGTIIQGNSLDADTVRYGPDYGIQVEASSAAYVTARVLLGPNGIRKSVVQDYLIGTNNPHVIVTRYSTNESTGYSGLFISRLETIGAKLGNTNSGADVTIPLELQTPASGVPVITARRLSFPKLGIRVTGSGMDPANQNGWLFMNEEEGYFGAQLVYSTNTSTLRLGGTGNFQNYTRDAEIAGDIGGTTDLPSRKLYLKTPLGTGAGASNNAGFTFQLPAGGSSGTTAHSLYDAVRIGANGSAPTSGQTPLELWDYGAGTMSRVKVSSGAEKSLYLGTDPTFGGGTAISTNGGNAAGLPVVIQPNGSFGTTNRQTVSNLVVTGAATFGTPIGTSNLDSNVLTQAEGDSLYQPAAPLLLSVAALGVNGLLTRTTSSDIESRTIIGGNGITVADGDGVAGNPIIGLSISNEINGGLPNAPTGKVHWSEIIGMPAGIADGSDAQGAFTWDVEVDTDTAGASATPVYTNLISDGYTHQLRLFVTAGGPTNQGAWQHNVAIGRSSSVTNFGASLYSGIALGSGVGITSYCQQAGSSFVVYVRGITNENVHWNIVGSRITTTNGAPSGGGGQIFLVNETFEGTGNPGGWTTSGSPNWDYTTSPINGSQSFYAATTSDLAYYAFTASTNLWVKARFRLDSLATAFDFLSLRDSAGSATLAKLNVRTNGSIRAYQGTQFTASSSGAVIAGTNGYLWMQYIPSTGGNGIVNAYVSTNSTRPGSPTAAVTIGDATATPGQIRLLGGPSVYDDVQVSETDIP